jgi:peroxiredoxin Q/BCP
MKRNNTSALGLALLLPVLAACGVLLGGCGEDPEKVRMTSGDPEYVESAAASTSPAVGKKAPAFTLPDQAGAPVSLSDLAGSWVVLYFYPEDDTPGCTCQATEFTDLLGSFHSMNAVVYGVSADSPAEHRKFIDKYALKLDLLSDEDRSTMRRYGAWVDARLGEQSYGKVIRTTYIIGPEGVIRAHWPEVVPQGHAERVALRLRQLQRSR